LPLVLKRVSEEKVRLLKAEAARRGLSPSEAVEEAIDLWLRSLGSAGGLVEDSAADDLVWVRMREKLRREARGRYVVIAGGRLVGVYDSLEEAARKLRELRSRGVRRAVLVRPGVDDEAGGGAGEWLGGSLEAQ
jgi:hypothetical protein